MRRILPALALILPLLLHADFDSAASAYRNKNFPAAFEEFSSLAESGDARSQAVLAIMYKYGEGTETSLANAFYWYQQAAEQGYPPAMYNAGMMLADGLGVEADADAAREWLDRAVSAGYERAGSKLAELNGDAEFSSLDDPPVAWSRKWNLRLPNEYRFADSPRPDLGSQGSRYRVQLGAMSSAESAERLWKIVLDRHGSLFSGLEPLFRPATSGDKTIWRVQAGAFDTEEEAQHLCELYLAAIPPATGCLVVVTPS